MTRAIALLCLLAAACTPLRPGDELCPPGSPGPVASSPDPQELSGGLNHPVALTVVGGTIYWVDQGPPAQPGVTPSDEGTVAARDLCARDPITLVPKQQARPTGLAVAGGFVYFVNGGDSDGAGELKRVPVGGTPDDPAPLSTGEKRPSGIAADGDVIYFVDQGDLDGQGVFVPGTGSLRRYDPASNTTTTLVDGLDAPSAVAARDGMVAWAAAGRGAIVTVNGPTKTFAPMSGSIETWRDGQRTLVADQLDAPIAITLLAGHVYWLDRGVQPGTGKLHRDDALLAEGLDFPGALAVDEDEDVYVAVTGSEDEEREGRVTRHRPGAPEVQVAAEQQLPRAVAVDRHLVYWVDYGLLTSPSGQVLARGKDVP